MASLSLRIFSIAGLAALALSGARLQAQPAPVRGAPAVPGKPPVPPLVSPTELFRKLLAASSAEWEALLQNKKPEAKTVLLSKVREYKELSPEEREWRLRTLDLRFYLTPLMQMAPSNRQDRLALIPEADRVLVTRRLLQWDILPPDIKTEFLENEMAIRLFVRPDAKFPYGAAVANTMSTAQQKRLDDALERWKALPPEKQRYIYARFQQMFELDEREKAETLALLSAPEREQMEQTLGQFARLPADQRERCMRGFQKFTALSDAEKIHFLRNAERWRQMSPTERQLWREIVQRVSLPLPYPPNPKGAALPIQPNASSLARTNP